MKNKCCSTYGFFYIFLFLYCSLIGLVGCQNQTDFEQGRSLENALSTFELEEGFQIELIAAEPLISDPVDMEIDEYGRIYVVEMHGYPLDVSGSGKIKLLSDSNGDGTMDKSTVFADSLTLPTGIMRWKKGIMVTDPPYVYYLEDSNGDGKADIKEIVLTGFALSNPQHNVNSPKLGLDNWIYLGHEPAVTTTIYEEKFGDRGTDVYYSAKPEGVRLSQNAGGRSVRFRPDTYELELSASRTQFGHTSDAWGHRFLVNNSNHIIQDVIAAPYLDRNPYLLIANSTQSSSDHGSAAEVFPITENPQHQLLTDVGVMTSACGLTAYLGASFPSGYENATFVAEPVSNIVHIDLLEDKGTGFIASRQHPEKEFLASTDSWFRPVNMYVGPDGALYVLDYYRQIIEHPEWMAEEVVNSGALYNGTDKGRIYRITSKGTGPIDWTDKIELGDMNDGQLVEKLADPNSWWRRNAQRLLVDRNPSVVPEVLIEMAENTESPLGRLHALWTLEGMGKLNAELIRQAMDDPVPGVRESAVKLAELHLQTAPELADALLELQSDTDPKVRFQLLCTLGFLESQQAAQARKDLLFSDIEDEWVQIAALSAPFSESSHLLEAVLEDFRKDIPAYGSLVQRLSAMTGASQQKESILTLIKKATASILGENSGWQVPILKGLAQGIQSKKISSSTFNSAESLLVKASFEHSYLSVRQASLQILQVIRLSENYQNERAMENARRIAGNKALPEGERALGIDFMALRNPKSHESFLKELINPTEPLPVQLSALKALGTIPDDTAPQYVLQQWTSLTPEIRDEAINIMMANPERISVLLDAMENGVIQPANIGWRRSVRLMAQKDEDLRVRARFLINREEGQSEEILQEYQPALEFKGSMSEGKAVFQRNCAICHQMGEDVGIAFGPDLSSLKNRTPNSIMNDILDPNLSIADGYDLWAVELQNGETLQGIISSETPTAISLRNAGGQDIEISRQDIKNLKVLDMSAMPMGLEKNINHQEMADLLAYIRKIE
jgi:putative membrane-bound dehydrogenase-like protein